MRYLIYTRVSHTKDNGVSHDVQISDCLKHVKDEEYLIFSESDVRGDAEIEDRPVLNDLLGQIKKDDILMVWKMDRLTRSIDTLSPIIKAVYKKNANLYSYLEPTFFEDHEDAELMRNITVAIAQREVKVIRKRIKSAMQLKKSRGECIGNVPYGYVREGKYLVPDEYQQKNIEYMIYLYEEERLNYREVAERLNKEGIQNRGECPWSKSAIHRCLTRRLEYAECYTHRQTEELLAQ